MAQRDGWSTEQGCVGYYCDLDGGTELEDTERAAIEAMRARVARVLADMDRWLAESAVTESP